MSDESEDRRIDMLPWLENWWNTSGHNPTYAWEALGHCLAAGGPIPEWVRDYFLQSATHMRSLSWGRDFRKPDGPKITPDQAKGLVGEALGLWRPKSKNAFARRVADGIAARAALDDQFATEPKDSKAVAYFKNGQPHDPPTRRDVAAKLKKARHVDDDRAGRLVRYGRALNSRPQKDDGEN